MAITSLADANTAIEFVTGSKNPTEPVLIGVRCMRPGRSDRDAAVRALGAWPFSYSLACLRHRARFFHFEAPFAIRRPVDWRDDLRVRRYGRKVRRAARG